MTAMAVAAATAALAVALSQGDPAAGERFYRKGIGASGRPVPALLQGDIRSDGATLPCASCHLGSGFGNAEGGQVAPPLRWHRLAARGKNTHGARRSYDEETLARAVTEGLDSEGRRLASPMPRYALEPRDRANLSAFLRSRGGASSPGVRDGVVTLAVVVTPDADPGRVRAMEAALAPFRDHRNPRPGTAWHGPPPLSEDGAPQPIARGYRAWKLSIWRLSGAPDGWRAQLDRRLREAPPFALVSGMGGAEWGPVERFCEEHGVPCILPNVDAPPDRDRWWSLYYSRGVRVEAEVLARAIPRAAHVAQVFRAGTPGAVGAARLARLRDVVTLEPGAPMPEGIDALVLWLRAGEAARYVAGRATPWISATAAGDPAALPPGARLVQPYALAAEARRRSARFDAWARARGVERGDFRVQDQTFFAFQLVAHALAHMGDDLDREYLLERIEHTAGMELFSASYARLSFGPGQRFLSKGAYVTTVQGSAAGAGDWIVP